MLLHIFILTAKYQVGTYYWFCPIGQELSLRNKGHLPKLTQESFGKAISDDPLTSMVLFHLPRYWGGAGL